MSFLTDLESGLASNMLPYNKGKFNDPFLLPSNEYFPTRLDDAWDFCAHLWYLNSTYRQASKRVCSHFITDIEFDGPAGDHRERKDLKELLRDSLQVFQAMLQIGMEWACFQGDTKVVTKDGVFPIRELAGKSVEVLSKDGIYRPADFRSYGVQPLMEIEFCDGRKVYATPEHKWEVRNGGGKIVEVTTEDLCTSSHRIKRTVAPRPEKNDDYYEGIRHGFVFGDGSQASKNRTNALFCGEKDKAMLPFFEGHGNDYIERTDRTEYGRIGGLPGHYKTLPANEESASYWYGFVSGFLAADGTVDTHGCAMLTQCDEKVLRAIEEQLPRIGMVAGPIRSQVRDTEIRGRSYKDQEIFFMTLLKQFVTPEDILLPCHRENFEKHWNPDSKYGQWMRIQSVRDTGLYDEVFCCTEMETHRIVIENGILSGQCYGNGFAWMYFPFNRYLVDDRDPNHKREWALENFEKFGEVRYNMDRLTYTVVDPLTLGKSKKGRKTVELPFRDRLTMDLKKIRIIILDPRYIVLRHSFWSNQSDVIWRFDPDFLADIKDNKLHQINNTPIAMLRAIANDEDFLFHPDEVFHLKAPSISGISNRGWGMPEVLANYRELHQIQVYRKIDEAVGMDYLLPFRIFSPNISSQAVGENTYYTLLGQWEAQVQQLIANRRNSPFAIHAMPFPVEYNEHGAQGKEYAPKDMLEWQVNNMLDAFGYPAELFHGSMQVQQIPTSIRLFENAFLHLFLGFHNFLTWSTGKIQRHASMEDVKVSLQPPRIADNLEKTPMFFQLAAGGEIPRSYPFGQIGIEDPVEAFRERKEEDAQMEKIEQEIGQKLQREQQLGSMSEQLQQEGAAGAMPAGGSGAGLTPLDTMQQAEQEAAAIVEMEPGAQQQQWDMLRQGDPTYYAIVKQKAEEYRRGAEQQGRASLRGGGP